MDWGVWGVIATVVAAHFIALVSPGPDFILVVKSGIRNTARNAMGVALGIATANAVYIFLCLIGVGALLAKSIVAMTVMKVLGGLFLLYVALMALKSKRADYGFLAERLDTPGAPPVSFLAEFGTGFLSGILNPKNPIFYLSIFSLVLSESVGVWLRVGLGAWMAALVFLWDACIILVLARPPVRKAFARVAFYVDKLAGAILGLVGLKLVQAAVIDQR